MVEGEVVSFNARVDDYLKGYEKNDYDYKLSRPSKIVPHGLPEWDDYDGPDAYRNKPLSLIVCKESDRSEDSPQSEATK